MIHGLYRGLGLPLVANTLYGAIYFGGYSSLKRVVSDGDTSSFAVKWGLGLGVSTVAEAVRYPINFVRWTEIV